MGIDEYSILRKKQKKNAFAATALLISIAIALLVMVGAVLILGKVNDKDRITPRENGSGSAVSTNSNDGSCEGLNKEIVFNDNIKNIKDAAINYFTNARLPKELNESKKITLREMKEKKLVLNVRDASANTCDGNKSYVEVTKGNNEYIMKILLSCSDIEDHIIVHLGCYDYCDKDVCEKEVEPEKVYEYEYKKTTSCTMSDWSSWGAWKTVREKTSNLKKEDTKVETVNKNTTYKYDAVASKTSYNCNKYSGYTLSGTKCVKTETINSTKEKDTYNCDKYGSGYSLSGTKCIKNGTKRVYETATKNEPTYSCPSGYTKTTITYTVKSGDTINSVASANYISVSALKLANNLSSNTITVGQKLTIPAQYQTRCYRDVTGTEPKPAKAIYTKTPYTTTCYENICSTDFIPSCVNGICKMEEIRTCDKVARSCKKTKQVFSHYDCSDYSTEYKPVGDQCIRTYSVREYTNATKNTDTYNCSKYSGYTLSGTQCYKDVPAIVDEQKATVVTGKYVCTSGYTLTKDNKCSKTITKDADKNPTTYSCMSDYTLTKDNKCTKTVSTGTKVTYYRYATRTCTGGKTYVKWSLDSNDKTLLNDGYKKTNNKREYKGIIEK